MAKASFWLWSPSTRMSWSPPPFLVEFLSVISATPASISSGPVIVAFLPSGLSSNATLVGLALEPLFSSSSPHAANGALAATTASAASVLRLIIEVPLSGVRVRTRPT